MTKEEFFAIRCELESKVASIVKEMDAICDPRGLNISCKGTDIYKAFHKEMEYMKLGFNVSDDEDSAYSSMYCHEDLEMLKRINKSFEETKEESR